jgi:UDP-N-acetylmuramate--alanine ligase
LSSEGAKTYFYVGIAGSGMSALAQFQAMRGFPVAGSDRSFDRGGNRETRQMLKKLGVRIYPQDGSGVGPDTAAIVVSTAVEDENPDLKKARGLGLPAVHRSRLLADWAAQYRTVAVAGTSGKSTVAAMVFDILDKTGRAPSLITGGNLIRLQKQGLAGNAFAGTSDLLVIEADESDGSLLEYRPRAGLVLNMSKDHKDLDELTRLFSRFLSQSEIKIVNGDDHNLAGLAKEARLFGFRENLAIRARDLRLTRDGSGFSVSGTNFTLKVPGRFNAENGLAAIAAASALGLGFEEMAGPLREFEGIARRFEVVGIKNNIEVVDDFAHNPVKIVEALKAARLRASRVVAVFQLHGFGPARFLKDDFISAFESALGPRDVLLMPEIYYAGGTAVRDVSARDIAGALAARDRRALFFGSLDEVVPAVKNEARPGDVVLVMGARDPRLPGFCRKILDNL